MHHLTNNPHLSSLNDDILYHLGIRCSEHDLRKEFGDVKYVCMGGSADRMRKLAAHIGSEMQAALGRPVRVSDNLVVGDRYVMYKAGCVLCVSHGVGIPSMSVVLHEVFKLLAYAGADDPKFFRVGTSGGLGLEPGTVVCSTHGLSPTLELHYETAVFGKVRKYPSELDAKLTDELVKLGATCDFPVKKGVTLGTFCFYEGQGRLDGAFCDYDEKDKFAFLNRVHDEFGVRNIEMESMGFAALTKRANCRAAIVCVTLLNRLNGDQVQTPTATLKEYESRAGALVTKFILGELCDNNNVSSG